MALTVENGTGLADAESYETVAEFKAYADKVGYDYAGYSDAQIEQALRRSTAWIDARYGKRFKGYWTTVAQALEWPRAGVVYKRTVIDYYTIPPILKNALSEAVWRELADPGSLSPDQGGAAIKRDKVGDVETEFRATAVGTLPTLTVVDDILSYLLEDVAFAYVGKAVRG